MDRRAKPFCLREWGESPGVSRDFAPTQVRRRPAPAKRRGRSNSVPLGRVQRRRCALGHTSFSSPSIRARLITQTTTSEGAGRCLTSIRPNYSAFICGIIPSNPSMFHGGGPEMPNLLHGLSLSRRVTLKQAKGLHLSEGRAPSRPCSRAAQTFAAFIGRAVSRRWRPTVR
jgi:hypothetical protein